MSWKITFAEELSHARQARQQGKEGQARVLARRAAGYPIRAFYSLENAPSAYELLLRLKEDEGAPAAARRAAEWLTLRVDEAFRLPAQVDLLQETENLALALFPVVKNSKGE